MLVECPNCKISFSPEMGVCPRCRKFRPTLAESDEFIRNRLRLAIAMGVDQNHLLELLQDAGVSSANAAGIVDAERRGYKREVRLRAIRQILLGAFLVVILGPIFLCSGILFVRQGAKGKGPGEAICVGVGFFIVGFGFLGFGAVRLIRGREGPIKSSWKSLPWELPVTLPEMPDRDPALLQRLRDQLDAARQLALQPRETAGRFGRSDVSQRPWRGNDSLILRDAVTSLEVRYLIREPVVRSWEFTFGAQLTADELYGWLSSLK
jgi:hypothetical protein